MKLKRALLAAGAAILLGFLGTACADGNIDAGKAKAGSCAGCHGANGEGKAPSPALAGMAKSKFVQAMKDYKSGKRDNAMMKTFAKQVSEEDVENLAAYYASLKGK
jgi:cytochrome c553